MAHSSTIRFISTATCNTRLIYHWKVQSINKRCYDWLKSARKETQLQNRKETKERAREERIGCKMLWRTNERLKDNYQPATRIQGQKWSPLWLKNYILKVVLCLHKINSYIILVSKEFILLPMMSQEEKTCLEWRCKTGQSELHHVLNYHALLPNIKIRFCSLILPHFNLISFILIINHLTA